MDDGGSQLLISHIILAVFIIIEAVLTAFVSALDTVGEGDIRDKGGKRTEWLLGLKEHQDALTDTLHIISVLFGTILGYFFLHGAAVRWEGRFAPAAMAGIFIAALFLFVILGIQLPRAAGIYKGKETLFPLAGMVRGLLLIFLPFTGLVRECAYLLALPFGINTKQQQEDVTEEEIISMVNEGHEQGVLEANEAEMINNIFEFGDKEAQDIMTHRINIVGVDGRQNLHTALGFMLNATNSRFPVYEENIDNITGIIHLKDAMRCHTEGEYEEWLIKDIPGLIRPAVFIPETRKINLLFKSMQSKKLQMVMVADEYGQTAGLVALEDILEEIVGNIQDEYDEDEVHIEEQPDGSFLVDGMTPLEELEDRLSIEFNLEEDIGTLNGYLVSKLDKIPSEDENSVIRDLGYSFQILSVAHKKIQKVRIEKLPEEMTEQYNIEKE